ncbi:chemotaxis protein CheW [Dactylosporangium sp. NPDC000244]|uniref:chemotaxis protein CheW n=1 Tax=Dactylosporangium sp. NPDC000244 TaxID=3154365 RepID=UPI003330BF1F
MQDQLIFGVGRLLCALPLAAVVETVRPLPVQPVGGAGGALLGVAVIRGAAVPVVDTAALLGDPGVPPSRFVTVDTPGGTVAFATGPVAGVRSVARSAAQPSPVAGELVEAVGVLDGRPLLFLNPESAPVRGARAEARGNGSPESVPVRGARAEARGNGSPESVPVRGARGEARGDGCPEPGRGAKAEACGGDRAAA